MNSKVKFTKIGAGKESFTFRSCLYERQLESNYKIMYNLRLYYTDFVISIIRK